MADQDKRDMAGLAQEWRANPEAINLAVGVVTAALLVEGDDENPEILMGALRPMIEAGQPTILQTFGAMTALMVRSINTMADVSEIEPQELWASMAGELTNERKRPGNGKK